MKPAPWYKQIEEREEREKRIGRIAMRVAGAVIGVVLLIVFGVIAVSVHFIVKAW